MPETTRGLPYPTPTDPPDGPDQLRQLAEATDLLVPRAVAQLVTVSFANAASASASVTFPAGMFSAPPVVVVSMVSGAGGTSTGIVARAHSVTAGGCTVQATHVGGSVQSGPLTVGLWAVESGPVSVIDEPAP